MSPLLEVEIFWGKVVTSWKPSGREVCQRKLADLTNRERRIINGSPGWKCSHCGALLRATSVLGQACTCAPGRCPSNSCWQSEEVEVVGLFVPKIMANFLGKGTAAH